MASSLSKAWEEALALKGVRQTKLPEPHRTYSWTWTQGKPGGPTKLQASEPRTDHKGPSLQDPHMSPESPE